MLGLAAPVVEIGPTADAFQVDASVGGGQDAEVGHESARPPGLGRRDERDEVRAVPRRTEEVRSQAHGLVGGPCAVVGAGDGGGEAPELVVERGDQPHPGQPVEAGTNHAGLAGELIEDRPVRRQGLEVEPAVLEAEPVRIDVRRRGPRDGDGAGAETGDGVEGPQLRADERQLTRGPREPRSDPMLRVVEMRLRDAELLDGTSAIPVARRIDAGAGRGLARLEEVRLRSTENADASVASNTMHAQRATGDEHDSTRACRRAPHARRDHERA